MLLLMLFCEGWETEELGRELVLLSIIFISSLLSSPLTTLALSATDPLDATLCCIDCCMDCCMDCCEDWGCCWVLLTEDWLIELLELAELLA